MNSTLTLQAVSEQGEALDRARIYSAAFITSQGVPPKFGRNRQKTGHHAVAAMRVYLIQHRPLAVQPHDTTWLLEPPQ